MTNTILKLSEAYLNVTENKYIGNQITGSMVTNKVLHYYDILENLISEKYKGMEEKEYKAYKSLLRRNEENKFSEALESLKRGWNIVFSKEKESENEIKKQKDSIFGVIEDIVDEDLLDIFEDDEDDEDDEISEQNLIKFDYSEYAERPVRQIPDSSFQRNIFYNT